MLREAYRIDTEAFVRHGGHLEGTFEASAFERLAGELAAARGKLSFALDGRAEGDHRMLMLEVRGRLSLTCQRCLGGIEFPLEIDARFRLVRPSEDWPEDELEDDTLDAIPDEGQIDALTLVEDEVLLALPVSPRHAQCSSPRLMDETARRSPFAVLGSLKRGGSAH